MKLFLTGGTGFVGSHFINQASEEGHEIFAHRRSTSSEPRIPLRGIPTWVDANLGEVPPDLLKGCDCLVHLAAHSANVPYDTLENCIQQNVIVPLQLFRIAVDMGIRRFIVAGSFFEYGRAGERYEFIPPNAPLEPTSSYPASKAAATVAFHAFACEKNVELLIRRVFHVYGPGEPENRFWPSLRRAALSGEDFAMSDGLQIRDFIPVEEVAAQFLTDLSRTDLAPGKPVVENLGTGQAKSLADFAQEQWQKLGATGNLRTGEVSMRPNEAMRCVPEVR